MRWVHEQLGLWLLYLKDERDPVGAVAQFYGGAPYYGTWDYGSAKGRTGPMGDLLECKARVERAIRPN